jgi:hypothetical protein
MEQIIGYDTIYVIGKPVLQENLKRSLVPYVLPLNFETEVRGQPLCFYLCVIIPLKTIQNPCFCVQTIVSSPDIYGQPLEIWEAVESPRRFGFLRPRGQFFGNFSTK